jgi:hypothetical protein
VTKVRGLLLCALAALTCAVAAGAARATLDVGITDDVGKSDGGASFFARLNDLGAKENRVSIVWNPSSHSSIGGQNEIDAWMPQAQASGTRIVFAIYSQGARDLYTASAKAQFVAFVQRVARTYPAVKDYVIGNEPNVNFFWQPQYNGKRQALAAASYMQVLAGSYDALKAVNPTINVIGVGLSPRGNDQPRAKSNPSRSPVRFIHDLGVAYRKSRRQKPLMDEFAFHPYPAKNTDSPRVGYRWPNAGLPNLGRIKQAFWDAFNGTAQPTFAESGVKTFGRPVKFVLDEVGWQVAPLPSLANLYFGTETDTPVSEATQAQYYSQSIILAQCDPSVRLLSFFHLVDDPNLRGWQSGLERAGGSRRPAYDAVKQTIVKTRGTCQGKPVRWRHTNAVVAPRAVWGNLKKAQPVKRARWSFRAVAGEQATFRAGIFGAGSKKAVLRKRLAKVRPRALLNASGTVRAIGSFVNFPRRRLRPGRYIYAIRMSASMNPKRVSVLFSRVFRVGSARR